jgi:hypothetical protein
MRKRMAGAGATALVMAMLAGSVAQAQDMEMTGHPAHIHSGSCPDVGDVVGPLSDVSGQFLMDGTATVTPSMGSSAAIPVEASFTSAVAVPYADLFAAPHSIVVHKGPSDEDIRVYILCGDIGGPEMGATDIAIGLGTLSDSGYTGIATIHDNGDGTVKVAVYITTGHAAMMGEPMESPDMMGEPMASPAM